MCDVLHNSHVTEAAQITAGYAGFHFQKCSTKGFRLIFVSSSDEVTVLNMEDIDGRDT
jgi:hypothetical protein